ncbi:unnamed protein product [Scytosiphon promiscuus]
MAKPGSQKDIIVSAALNHAASIHRTLWMREYKREHGSASPPFLCCATTKREGDGEPRGCDTRPPLLDGPIYSAEFWRAWKIRSKAAARGGSKRGSNAAANVADKKCTPARSIASCASRMAATRPSTYDTPTSSFAGGRCGTQIFAALSGRDCRGGSGLLRAHHDAVRKPLRPGESRSTAVSSSVPGIRLSHSNPRGEKTSNSKRSAGDGMYDIALADKIVMRTTPSCSFKSGAASASETAVQGISRDTPGAIYSPSICSTSASIPAISFSSTDRFAAGNLKSETPGPGHYQNASAGSLVELGKRPAGRGAVAWTGVETFMDSEWSRPTPPPHLRSWRGFGNGCSVAEHVGYGACLDGRCCSRHSVEKKNALRVVQFLGRKREGGGKERASRRQPPTKEASSKSNSPPVRHQENITVCDSPVDDSTVDTSVVSSTALQGESAGVAGVKERQVAGRRRTPLHFAAERGELSLVDRLCHQGDDRNAVDERGYTPLHDAADKGNTRVVSRLLEGDEVRMSMPADRVDGARGATPKRPRQVVADPNVQDSKGRTPLYLACLHGHERAVRVLLDAGACPDLVDIRGKPAQEVAGAQRIYQLLQFKTDVSLVKANIAALEEREHNAERQQRKAAQVRAVRELAELKAEELRLRVAVDALEKKRAAYAAAAKTQC